MKRELWILLACCLATRADASISVGVAGPGTLNTTYEGSVFFPQNGFTGDGTITDWSMSGLDAVIKTVTYAAADLDFTPALGSGFRWAEIVTNASATPWTSYTIALIDTDDTASGTGNFLFTGIGAAEVPGFASIAGNVITVLSTVGDPLPVTGWVLNLSGDQREITMTFPTPVLPGESFQVHIPIVNLGDGGGVFVLSQQAGGTGDVVPEPMTCVVWGLLGTMGIGAACWNKRRSPAVV